ncbi:MAG: chemotaxis protein CheW, partial [Treponema sp.]|nr:chemotaxis protein CheW [Treponema sp.]
NGKNGYVFKPVIKDSIVFEYHDILNEPQLPDLDIILMRDLLSYLPIAEQDKQIAFFGEKLKKTGVVILGKNEVIADTNWRSIGEAPLSVFMYNG